MNNKEGLIAIFYLGNGTSDVLIVEISNGVFEVKATKCVKDTDDWLGTFYVKRTSAHERGYLTNRNP